ncbi:DUF6642 family protein [Flavobacterium frigidarium]|uniref:DUF6642 family protein n=1 Tax=Flavobacterium frigidarium TaxID=99286 RepID=UPI0004290DE3|nr:DUF6642 family protein [Flavobacterium frigidarium]
MNQLDTNHEDIFENFIFCLEGVPDIEESHSSEVVESLEKLAFNYGLASIYKTCDTIEGLEESLNTLLYDDHGFKDYEIIYLVMKGEENSICLNDYYYTLDEIAEVFEGKLTGKILHFANSKVLDLSSEEAQFFLDVTGAKAISGYGTPFDRLTSINLDKAFFSFFKETDNVFDIVEELFQKNYDLCKLLDFRLYY